jgi:hypothetical protein
MISLDDLLQGRIRNLTEERRQERILHLSWGARRPAASNPV